LQRTFSPAVEVWRQWKTMRTEEVSFRQAKELLARTWMDAGRRVLAANEFVQKPTLEGLRALHLLLQWWSSEGGRYLEASLSITSSIVSAVVDLGLHQDPEELDQLMDPLEMDLRRRVFWATYTYDTMVRGAIGHPWSAFDEDDISCKFPQGASPSRSVPLLSFEAHRTTSADNATSSSIPAPLYSASILNARITKLTSRIKPITREEVTVVLDELEALDEPHSHDILRFAMVRWGYVRLQRFASKAGVTDGGRQDQLAALYFGSFRLPFCLLCLVLTYVLLAEELLSSTDAMAATPGGMSTVILLKMLSVSVAAAVDLAGSFFSPSPLITCAYSFLSPSGTPFAVAVTDTTAMQIARLVQTLRQRSFRTSLSRVVARGVAIIEHLLPTPAEEPPIQADFYAEPVVEVSYEMPKLATGTKARTIPGFEVRSYLLRPLDGTRADRYFTGLPFSAAAGLPRATSRAASLPPLSTPHRLRPSSDTSAANPPGPLHPHSRRGRSSRTRAVLPPRQPPVSQRLHLHGTSSSLNRRSDSHCHLSLGRRRHHALSLRYWLGTSLGAVPLASSFTLFSSASSKQTLLSPLSSSSSDRRRLQCSVRSRLIGLYLCRIFFSLSFPQKQLSMDTSSLLSSSVHRHFPRMIPHPPIVDTLAIQHL
jgi:hypothetical protein